MQNRAERWQQNVAEFSRNHPRVIATLAFLSTPINNVVRHNLALWNHFFGQRDPHELIGQVGLFARRVANGLEQAAIEGVRFVLEDRAVMEIGVRAQIELEDFAAQLGGLARYMMPRF